MKFWFDTLRSRLLLTLVTYALYLLLYIATDSVARDYYLGGGYPAWGYVIDIVTRIRLICSVTTTISIISMNVSTIS